MYQNAIKTQVSQLSELCQSTTESINSQQVTYLKKIIQICVTDYYLSEIII